MRISEIKTGISEELRAALMAPTIRRTLDYYEAEVSGLKPVIAIAQEKVPRGIKVSGFVQLECTNTGARQILKVTSICVVDGLAWIGITPEIQSEPNITARMNEIRNYAQKIIHLANHEEGELCSPIAD